MNLKNMFSKMRRQAGFTMIELLIVIAILGILAVAVLSAINPVEQINRGRDTGSQSDAEQLLGGMDRYNAFKGYFPWQMGATDTVNLPVPNVGATEPLLWDAEADFADAEDTPCLVSDKLSDGDGASCPGAEEMKISFFTRIFGTGYNYLYVYNRGTAGDSTYVCFTPKSGAFKTQAEDRCVDVLFSGLPADLLPIGAEVCGAAGVGNDEYLVCLP